MAVKKTTNSSKKLKAGNKKPLSKWVLAGGIAAVAVVGLIIVRFSGASSYSFVRTVTQLKGDMGGDPGRETYCPGKTKTITYQGKSYAPVGGQCQNSAGLITFASAPEIRRSSKICAHLVNRGKQKAWLNMQQYAKVGRASYERGGNTNPNQDAVDIAPGKTAYVCTKTRLRQGDSIIVIGNTGHNIAVDTVYGK